MVDQWLVFLQHTEKMKIIDNCIEKEDQDNIEKLLLRNEKFPWFFLEDITYIGKQKRPALKHYFIHDTAGVVSEFCTKTVIAPLMALNSDNMNVLRMVSFLQFPNNIKKVDTPHTDRSQPHTVLIYYVIDSDGDTVFYKNKKIIKRVTPKKGRAVIFDGSISHSAFQPNKHLRCIINFNIEK
jgi:hypothetical protein